MKIILASSNKGKIKEFKEYLKVFDVYSYEEVLKPFEIEESGSSFKENALIKSKAVYKALQDENAIVVSDDSGVSVPKLGGIPGIYSARFAGEKSNAKDNLNLLIEKLKAQNLDLTPAFYTACIAISTKKGNFSVHGWMHGFVTTNPRGENGFGYDSMFIPKGYKNTLGELDPEVKEKISHRAKALELAKILLKTLIKEEK